MIEIFKFVPIKNELVKMPLKLNHFYYTTLITENITFKKKYCAHSYQNCIFLYIFTFCLNIDLVHSKVIQVIAYFLTDLLSHLYLCL